MTREHCPFRKTILGGTCQCSKASMSHLPSGCSVTCSSADAFDQCEEFLKHLITSAQFALHYVEASESFTHGKLMKVQHGGLKGLLALMEESEQNIEDINALVTKAVGRYGDVETIPVELLLPYIKDHKNKRRKNN